MLAFDYLSISLMLNLHIISYNYDIFSYLLMGKYFQLQSILKMFFYRTMLTHYK